MAEDSISSHEVQAMQDSPASPQHPERSSYQNPNALLPEQDEGHNEIQEEVGDRDATNHLVHERMNFRSAAISGITFLGSVFIILSILFSPEIALAIAFHFATTH